MPPSPVETIGSIAAMAGVGYVTFAMVSFNEMKNVREQLSLMY